MEKILGAAVIGCGNISRTHLRALTQASDIRVVALCDSKLERALQRRDEYGLAQDIFITTDYRDILARADVDAVHILTPHYLHSEMALAALAAGKYVLCEKPMAIHVDQAQAMIQADPEGKRLGIIFQNRYNEATVKAKAMLDSGELGKVRTLKASVTWKRDAAYYNDDWHGRWATEGGGSLINQAIHTVDLLYHLGGAFEAIKGSVSTDLLQGIIEVEENSHAVIRYADGKTGLLHTSNSFAVDMPPEVVIVCEEGVLRMQGNNLILEQKGESTVLVTPSLQANGTKAVYGNSHVTQILEFYRCIREDAPFWVDAREAYPAIWAVLSIYASSCGGQWIPYAAK